LHTVVDLAQRERTQDMNKKKKCRLDGEKRNRRTKTEGSV